MNHIAIFVVAKFDVKGESIDEERNQKERSEEGRPEEKEVGGPALNKGCNTGFQLQEPRFSGAFLLFQAFLSGFLFPLSQLRSIVRGADPSAVLTPMAPASH
jgi:hypothetical protein